ncbi:MAG: hypothetical protein GWN18_02865, partial [Thermoplasmata archaeon]|nr:hypothetical protein [Thermoplasmata archaeon]NIU48041.1 hypothetical protein [Thermoplasmata archaeon]NIV77696.1 hypothetical protein [Thermoplasmata archaeon]NIW81529.1 hypothetical protein [Thermoplasmata archaeon]NIW87730.1 hypothetical protein [Thermoplasmata archaeon]
MCSEEVKGDPKWELVRCTNCRKTFPDTRDTCPACNSEQASLLDHVE